MNKKQFSESLSHQIVTLFQVWTLFTIFLKSQNQIFPHWASILHLQDAIWGYNIILTRLKQHKTETDTAILFIKIYIYMELFHVDKNCSILWARTVARFVDCGRSWTVNFCRSHCERIFAFLFRTCFPVNCHLWEATRHAVLYVFAIHFGDGCFQLNFCLIVYLSQLTRVCELTSKHWTR